MGGRSAEVKDYIKRDETALLTNLSGDSVITRAEAARLRNDNLNLRKQIEDRVMKAKTTDERPPSKTTGSEKRTTKVGGLSYVVESGDTLFSISRKFYKSPSHWKEIRDANKGKIESPSKLKPGSTLTIP
jgi:LysM repeat protein